MSQQPPPPYRPPANAAAGANPTATPAARPVNSELTTILMNIPNLVKMANSGGLTEIQIRQVGTDTERVPKVASLRQLIRQHTPTILSNAQARGLPNPLLNLPAVLDPHQPWEGAIANAVIKQPNPTPATNSTASSTNTAASTPQTLAQRQAQAQASGTATPTPATGNATQTPTQRPAGTIQLSEQQVRAMINLTPQQRESYFINNPAAKSAFQSYITRLRAHSNATARATTIANGASTAPPSTTSSNVLPNLAIPAGARRDQLPSQRAAPTRPEEPRLAPVIDELALRKRRMRDMLGDMEPQTEMEVGVAEILKDAADELMADALREACRLAKHRKSGTVEVKDIALAMDMHHSITVPGFQVINDQPRPNTFNIDETQRKRARGVFPRRRMALEAIAKVKEEA